MAGFDTSLRTARAQAIVTACGANAKFEFYNGTQPATGGAVGASVLLGTLIGGATIGAASGGAINFDEASFTQNNASHVNGTPTWVRVKTSANAFVMDLAIPTDAAWSGTIQTGVNIVLDTSAITEPNL